ncbi:MAG: hypothetical protein AB1324_06895 [Candidatus Micrarchaeota archaeon]
MKRQVFGAIRPQSPKKAKLVALDFDGTMTDIEKEAEPFLGSFIRSLAREMRVRESELLDAWEPARDKVLAGPSRFGLMHGGKLVAPAYADPYVLASAVAGEVSEALGFVPDCGRAEFLDRLFHTSYPDSAIVFREGARDFLIALSRFDACFVTNSRADSVRRKLSVLGMEGMRIFGEAKKNVLDDSWAGVPESIAPEGFGRPVYLRRKNYWSILENLLMPRSLGPGELLVAGDIYDMDLALPGFMGAHISIVSRPSTARHFLVAVSSHPGGFVSPALDVLLEGIMERTK